MADESNDVFTKGIKTASVWMSFIIALGGVIGNYYVNDYKIKESHDRIEKLDSRLSAVEKVNYDLLVEQLKQIESSNQALDSKLTSSNQRIDEILKIIINSK